MSCRFTPRIHGPPYNHRNGEVLRPWILRQTCACNAEVCLADALYTTHDKGYAKALTAPLTPSICEPLRNHRDGRVPCPQVLPPDLLEPTPGVIRPMPVRPATIHIL